MRELIDILKENEVTPTAELISLLSKEIESIKIPSKVEARLNLIKDKDFAPIHSNVDVAKELCLIILRNFNNTYIRAINGNPTEAEKDGWKTLNASVLESQVHISKKTVTYKVILDLLISNGIIERGKGYKVGSHSFSYRLTSRYFGKGVVEYKLKTDVCKKRQKMAIEENLSKVLTCPIAYNELINRSLIQLPTVEQVTAHLKEAVKAKRTNKKGKRIVFKGKNPKRYENQDVVFAEDYIEIFQYLQNITIPIISSERGGERVITTYNLMPSIIRELITVDNETLEDVDYSCLHPNICQTLFGGSNKESITHTKVAEYLGIDRATAKVGHLSYFNLPIVQMVNHKLHNYYLNNEPQMIENIIKIKEEEGYSRISTECFEKETELMRLNIAELREKGIFVMYTFDALQCKAKDVEIVREVMNRNAKSLGINTVA